MAASIPRRSDKDNGKPAKHIVRRAGEDVELAEKRALAMEYRREGWSYRDIAMLMESTISTVYAWVQGELIALRSLTKEAAEDVRDMELQRCDMLLNNLMPGIKAGDAQSIVAALRVGERRSKLLGLDAATKIDAKGAFMNLTPEQVAGMSDTEIQKVITNLVTMAGTAKMLTTAGVEEVPE